MKPSSESGVRTVKEARRVEAAQQISKAPPPTSSIAGSPKRGTYNQTTVQPRDDQEGSVKKLVSAMSKQLTDGDFRCPSNRITVEEIARRLDIGRRAVYALLEQRFIPAIRLGRRWIITRYAYEQWERTCGTPGAEPGAQPEVTV
jgi:excisionase family DNA binding protein